jgi:hypothetical protein
MDYGTIAPYGRSFEEYCLMFALEERDRVKRVIGVGDGPCNFNAEATRRGWRVVSVDPLYGLPREEVKARVQAAIEPMVASVALTPQHWTWSRHKDATALSEHRRATVRDFTGDLAEGARAGRYVAAALPSLPFRSGAFDLALCAHLLFSWSGVLDLDFHRQAIAEMLRVAGEVRIFPTSKNLAMRRSRYVSAIAAEWTARGCDVRIGTMTTPQYAAGEQLIITASGRG